MRFIVQTLMAAGAMLFIGAASGQPLALTLNNPSVDRWMYAFNFTPTTRPTASVYATAGDAYGVDTRHAQYLIGFDTFSQIETNRSATNYLVRRVRLTLVNSTGQGQPYDFQFDPTQDALGTYFETNNPGYEPDTDTGRPVELFGAGFRNGFTEATFVQGSAFGTNAPGQRSAYAAGYSTNGALVDVSNNVGKTNVAHPSFEVHPFAIGQTTNAAPGEFVPGDSWFTFDLNLADPLVRQYVQEALNLGRLRLMVSSLHDTGGQIGAVGYPNFYTHFSLFGDGPMLELEATAIRPDDSDNDGLPDDWENFYFDNLDQESDGDADHDGQANLAEYRAGTNPSAVTDKLQIISSQRETNGTFVLRFSFAASRSYVIEYSDNLQNWLSVENPALSYYTLPGLAEWRDDGLQTGGLSAIRFYRVQAK